MAIVHVAMKSSASAPPSAAHADYIARTGKYGRRGDVVHVEPGNMPEFAQADARAFWLAADVHERANGRAYTELQIALPRELSDGQRIELAQEAAREFMGARFAYILAVHNPVAKDKIEQPHLHIMFSERVVDERTRALPEEQFFKRNGAKKDREWNDRTRPEEIRAKWCKMMNRAMEREGIEERVDPRSWADQGREDLAALREEKELRGKKPDAVERREEIARLRELRKELPAPGQAKLADLQQLEAEAAAQIAAIERRLEEETGVLDRLIAKAKEALGQVIEWGQNLLASPKGPVFARARVAPDLARSGPPPPARTPEPASAVDTVEAGKERSAEAARTALRPEEQWEQGKTAVNLTKEYADALLIDRYGKEKLQAAYAAIHEGGGQSGGVFIMDKRVAIRLDHESGQLYAVLDREDKADLEKTLTQALGAMRPQPTQSAAPSIAREDESQPRRNPAAFNLTKEYTDALLIDRYGKEKLQQAYGVIHEGDVERGVFIMGKRVSIRFDRDTQQLFAVVEPEDKADFEKTLTRALGVMRSKDRDFEHE